MITDWKLFMKHIAKGRRKKLARWVEEESHGWTWKPLLGWSAKTTKSGDYGMMVLALKNNTSHRFALIVDDYDGQERYYFIEPDFMTTQNLAEELEEFAPKLPFLKSGDTNEKEKNKPFAGWKGGRPKRILSQNEKKQIDALRAQKLSIDKIAAKLHVSNRVVAAYCRAQPR